MVRKLVQHVFDDLDGSALEPEQGRSLTFSLEVVAYEIDLSNAHIEQLRQALAPYVEAGRRVRASAEAPAPAKRKRSDERLNLIRTWANENGFEVAPRGRVPDRVVQAFTAAH